MDEILKALEPLFKNTPLFLTVIGIGLIGVGATGGIEKLSSIIDNPGWRFAIAAIGAAVASFGGLLIWRDSRAEEPSALARKCALTITAPVDGDTVDAQVGLVGTFKKKPPEGTVVIIEEALGDHYLQHAPHFDERTSRWSGQYKIGSGERVLHIGILGKSAQALKDYYDLVGTQTNRWQGIKNLPPDLISCAKVTVRRK